LQIKKPSKTKKSGPSKIASSGDYVFGLILKKKKEKIFVEKIKSGYLCRPVKGV
jgi:hypothetical protein